MAPELSIDDESFCERELLQCYGLSETASSRVLKIRSMSRASSYLVGGLVQELICESRMRQERKWKSGSTGKLVARGVNVMRGYWNDPETRLSHFEKDVSHGDIGYQDSDGYFYILDRLKDMIVTGGEMFIPARSKRFLRTSRSS